ncbi:MAG: DNA-binding protein, partial [Christensenellaceae bacterium]
NKAYYKKLFADYPDIVDVVIFRQMLGGIGNNFARKIILENKVAHLVVGRSFVIPKICVINYVLSKDYAGRRLKVKV